MTYPSPFFRNRLRVLFLSLALILPGAGQGTAACLSPAEARQAVNTGAALRLGAIASTVSGEIVNAELCKRGERLVYRLAIIQKSGKVATVMLDARTGEKL